jgi:hypothetical protein
MTNTPFKVNDAGDATHKQNHSASDHLFAASNPSHPQNHAILKDMLHKGHDLAGSAADQMLHGFSVHDSSKNTDHHSKIATADATAGRVSGMSNPTSADISELHAHTNLGGSAIPGGNRHDLGYAEARVAGALQQALTKQASGQKLDQDRVETLKNPKMAEFKQKTNIADGNHWGNDTERLYKNAQQSTEAVSTRTATA